ncbi:hypothetical protein H5410_000519 [Solanum commersonii]|uniref:Uncharacterized protein n=1 Tax=Solanum commersonii TaxID=4109 RepID=A0A9J6AWZ9_SOLCO|nr:hypothetical protein H5410_000519 [Solanum commersonii]
MPGKVVWYTRRGASCSGEEFPGLQCTERMESIGVPGGSQESSMVRRKEDNGEGNEVGKGQGAGGDGLWFWICGGWRMKR